MDRWQSGLSRQSSPPTRYSSYPSIVTMVEAVTLSKGISQESPLKLWKNQKSKSSFESFIAGEEIDETDPKIDTSNLTEGEDFVRID